MPEITANIVVEPIGLTVTQENPGLDVTVDTTNLNIYTATSLVGAGGNVGELQYHAAGNVLAGASTTSVDANGNVAFSNISNVKIGGGTNGYFLQTDGTGNLTWNAGTVAGGNGIPGGANTQVQYNDGTGNFAGDATFTFDDTTEILTVPNLVVAGSITGTVANANFANFSYLANFATTANAVAGANVSGAVANATYASNAGNAVVASIASTVVNNAQPNITSVGTLTSLDVTGNVGAGNVSATEGAFTYVTGDGANLTNLSGANITGTVANATHASTANTVVDGAQANITSLGTLTSLNVSGTTSLYEAIENVALIGAQSSPYDFDLLDGSIRYSTANATVSLTINFKGNSTVTCNTFLANGQSVVGTYLMTTGSTGYNVNAVQIDGSPQTIKWVEASVPSTISNAVTSYTFTIIKTSTTPTYTVLGSFTSYA